MNRNNTWRFIIVIFALVWSVLEFYPPGLWGGSVLGRDVISEFEGKALKQDDTFKAIVAQAKAMQATNDVRSFGNLRDAIGTNDITQYFFFYALTNETSPTDAILNRLQREGQGRIKLGLDLQGGTSFLVELGTNEVAGATGTNALAGTNATARAQEMEGILSQAIEVLRKRVDRFGVAEPVIQPAGANRILIELPGLSQQDRDRAMVNIQKAAFLEFRMVHPDNEKLVNPQSGELIQGFLEPGYELMRLKDKLKDGTVVTEAVLVRKRAERGLNGSFITRAIVTRGSLGQPEIDFEMNDEGAAIFGEVTRENMGRRLAIVLDGVLYSAPTIRGEITSRGQITGSFDVQEAFELANVLENPLRAPLKIVESREVDPSLGKDSIQSGVKAAIYGIIAVAIFMLFYYMFAGMVANVALIVNVIVLLGVMCYVNTTFTLPGIAGIVLTVGMAVDANVLIYERIREELSKGKSLRGAIDAGYDRAFSTIFDSHVTTLISSVILIWLGTGSVKGFGVALTIGVAASLFTALVVTRLIFDFMLARNWIKSLKMLHLVPTGLKLNFMKFALPAFILSWLVILIGNGYGILGRGKDVLGVEFVGGYSISMNFAKEAKADKTIDVDKVRTAVDELGKGASQVSFQRDMSSGKETLRITVRETGDVKAGEDYAGSVIKTLQEKYPSAKFEKSNIDKIGPSVGAEIQEMAIIAALLALFGILVYVAFRYEFSFAIGAVVAILHDIMMTTGCYFLAGREMNATTVAALLTIIGFSINDTVVIFDRIREDLKLGVRGSFRDLMNAALNQTLSRTLITSGTVFIATLSLFIFGGGPINDFAFCFLVGIITGTYSSIYIASALVLWWHKGERPKIGATQLTVDNPMSEKKV